MEVLITKCIRMPAFTLTGIKASHIIAQRGYLVAIPGSTVDGFDCVDQAIALSKNHCDGKIDAFSFI